MTLLDRSVTIAAMKPAKPTVVVVLLLAAFAVLAWHTALVVPLGEGPDETAHLTYVQHLRLYGALEPGARSVPVSHHPSLYYRVASWAVSAWVGGDEMTGEERPGLKPSGIPGPYRTTLGTIRSGDVTRLNPAYAARFVSVFFGLLALLGIWYGARVAFEGRDDRDRLAAVAASVALLPGLVFSAAVVSNDIAVVAFSTWAYALAYGLATDRATGRGIGRAARLGALTGLVLIAAAMSKTSGCLAAVAVLVAACFRRDRSGWVAAGVAFAVFAAGLAAGGFYLHNWLAHGDPFLTRVVAANHPELAIPFPVNENYLGHVVARLSRGFLGDLGRQEISLARPIVLVAFASIGVAAGGVFLLARDRFARFERKPPPDPRDDPLGLRREPPAAEAPPPPPAVLPAPVLAIALVGIAVTFASLLYWNTRFYGPYGRYLHVVVSPVAVSFVAGVVRLFPTSFRWIGPVTAVGIALATVYTTFGDILPHYHPLRSKWARGEVVHYDDGGHPRTSPHRVRGGPVPGGDNEPWGTYSKARVPEMNVAWGAPTVTFRYDDLDPRVAYQVRFTYYGGRELGKFGLVPYQSLTANGRVIHGPIAVTFEPRELSYHLPAGTVAKDGELELQFRGAPDGVAAVAEVWIEKPWVSCREIGVKPDPPRAGGRVMVTAVLTNRDGDADHPIDVWLFARAADGAFVRLTGNALLKPIRAGATTQAGLVAAAPRALAGRALHVGVRRVDRGPWAILKGATNLGPGGKKRGDLAARDLHVATLAEPEKGGVVFAWRAASPPPAPWRIAVRYRTDRRGELAALDAAGNKLGEIALPSTDGSYANAEGVIQGGALARLAAYFPAGAQDDGPAIDEVRLWSESGSEGFHVYPTGKTLSK